MLKSLILIIIAFSLSSCSGFLNKDNNNTVKTKTGLMWKKCPEGLSGHDCSVGDAKKLTWTESINRYGGGHHDSNGYDDWRIPTKSEIKTLMRCNNGKSPAFPSSCDQKKVAIDRSQFPRVDSYPHYWTGTEHIIRRGTFISDAWVASFNNGFIYSADKNDTHHIRLVRGNRSHFTYPEDAEDNRNNHIGPFCCTGKTFTVRNGNKNNLGYIYFFGWDGQAFNTDNGAAFPNFEILVAGVKSKSDNSLVKERIVIPAKEDTLKKSFKVDAGCVAYEFSHIKARLLPYNGLLYFQGFPRRLEIDINTDKCR